MIGQGDVATLAGGRPSAGSAFHHRHVAAAVLEEDDLLLTGQRLADFFFQARRKRRAHLLGAHQFSHVGHLDMGQTDFAIARGERRIAILAASGVAEALEAGRGRSEQYMAGMETGHHHGGIAGMIARSGFLLFVTGFVLFVNDDELQALLRQKQTRASTEQERIRFGGKLLLPNLHALAIGKLGMIDAHAVAEDTAQALRKLRGQGDFGYQIKHLAALLDDFAYQADVDFGLAARRNAVEQADSLFLKGPMDFVERGLLGRREGQLFHQFGGDPTEAPHLKVIGFENTFGAHGREHRGRNTRALQQFGLADFLHELRIVELEGRRPTGHLGVSGH